MGANGWISVEERVPEALPGSTGSVRVIAYFPEDKWYRARMDMAYYQDGEWRQQGQRTRPPSHWMPLPQPPQESAS